MSGKKILFGLTGLAGLGLSGLAVFANLFGLGHRGGWGPGRIIVACMGAALLLIAGLIASWQFWRHACAGIRRGGRCLLAAFLGLSPIRLFLQSVQTRLISSKTAWDQLSIVRWYGLHARPALQRLLKKVLDSRLVRYFIRSQERMTVLVSMVLGLGIVLIYVWFVSVGRWTVWPKTTTYYDQLAEAFRHGQPNLLVTPDPALLKLADPYELNNRNGIPVPWDVVLYNGKFYIYWGPAPALVLAVVHLVYSGTIGDQILVFAFVCGTFLFEALILLRLRSRLFPSLGWPYILPGLILAGLTNPLPWLLNRPAIYEAAIAGGQFFMIAGLFWGFAAIDGQYPGFCELGLCGTCMVLALASRLTLAPATAFLVLMIFWQVFRQVDQNKEKTLRLLALCLPFVIGLVGLAWYNKIRFGSWFEFGVRYMLTGLNFQAIGDKDFSIANLLINLHNYLLNPFKTLSIFPYVKPDWGGHFIFFPIHGSEYSYSEQVSGLIPTTPYMLLAVLPVLTLLRCGWQMIQGIFEKQPLGLNRTGEGFLEWTALTFSGGFLLAFLPILLFIAATMRYLADVVPLLILLSTLGFWQASKDLAAQTGWRRLLVAGVVLLAVYSLVISLLLAVTGYEARFEKLNPSLFDDLTRLLSP